MNKYWFLFYMAIIIIITGYLFKCYINLGYYEGFEGSYQKCDQMTDCKTCVGTKTSVDGVCYWCNGQCKSPAKYYDPNNCSSSLLKCGTPTPTTPTTPPTTTPPTTCENIKNCSNCISSSNKCFWGDRDKKCSSKQLKGYGKICSGLHRDPTCPKCDECPKLTLLKTPTFITSQ
jgi:hypothetical protein